MKTQTKKVGVAGSFQNQMMGNNRTEPIVGKGATLLGYTDRQPYDVTYVSECGNKCEIRPIDTEWCGEDYGDQDYKYSSNPQNHKELLEWNPKRKAWGMVTYRVQIIKALKSKLKKEYGKYNWENHLPQGCTLNNLMDADNNFRYKLIDGVTKRYKQFNEVSIVFGYASKYRDPNF